ncbi:hypothetical protein O1611_g7409 [Lasiodiplodia mahajangana]|uniref:Uncharacterized protein n=1 Tax=Lasiodiplodia mahajangana TaxID=1108764 RepID=A0ACC2JFJ1_9PEZI|nr:hypothetical protein O1611_g7409 [Lasiodiplodia mahajangana]
MRIPGWIEALTPTALLLTMGMRGVAAAKPSPGCGNAPTLTGGPSTAHNLTVNGKPRSFFLGVPENYDKDHPYRLIFTLHALGGTASQVVGGTGGYYAWGAKT